MVEKMRQGAKEVAPRLGDSLTLSANNGKIVEVASRPSAPQTVTPRPIALKPRGLTKTHKRRSRPAFDCIALLLQGGGALGAYQAGVYEALAEAELHPDWIAGISIGAINGALIAGNAPEARVDKLRSFWERVTAKPCCDWSERFFLANGDSVRQWLNQMGAAFALVGGASGFFTPRFP